MTDGFLDFGLLEKMEPMARRALASLEAMQNALVHKNTEDVSKHIEDAENALSALKKDLNLVQSFEQTASITKSDSEGVVGEGLPMGNISQHNNTVSDYDGTEGAVVLGISRMGRSSTIWRPQSE